MDVTVTAAQGFPEKAFLSLRVGETRQQMHFKPGDSLHFDLKRVPWLFNVDVLQRIGSAQVWLSDFTQVGDPGCEKQGARELHGSFEVPRVDGGPMKLSAKVAVASPDAPDSRPASTTVPQARSASLKAKQYLEAHGVQKLLRDMVQSLLLSLPDDPITFMVGYLQNPEYRVNCPDYGRRGSDGGGTKAESEGFGFAESEDPSRQESPDLRMGLTGVFEEAGQDVVYSSMENFADIPGLGPDYCPGFPVTNCPLEMPDFSRNHTIMASVLQENPSIYKRLQGLQTTGGVGLARCIKAGVDNCGHPMIKVSGLFAGDADCYDTFRDLFEPVTCAVHKLDALPAKQPTDMDYSKVTDYEFDERVTAVRIGIVRNLREFPMLPAVTRQQRQKIERTLVGALSQLDGPLRGDYLPLGKMSEDEEGELDEVGALFAAPDSELVRSAGTGRDWPEARGIFATPERDLVAWVNEEDHLRLMSMQESSDIKGTFKVLGDADAALRSHLGSLGSCSCFAHHDRFGFLSSRPESAGTGLTVEVHTQLPLVTASTKFHALCTKLRLHAYRAPHSEEDDTWLISNVDQFNSSEVEQVNLVIDGVRQLLELDASMAKAAQPRSPVGPDSRPWSGTDRRGSYTQADLRDAAAVAQAINYGEVPGLGAEDCPGFPADACPAELPDIAQHHTITAQVLKKDPSIYSRLRGQRTRDGVSFARCIKAAMDNRAHPMVKVAGCYAGDGECYGTFSELFDPVIRRLFALEELPPEHPCEMDATRVIDGNRIDPSGKYVLGASVGLGRNLRNTPMLPAITRHRRREVENQFVSALSNLTGELSGEYMDLGGISEERGAELAKQDAFFAAPDSTFVRSSGSGRDWPDSRGIFSTPRDDLVVWVNQEDHVRLLSTSRAADLKGAFHRLCAAESALRDAMGGGGVWSRSISLGHLSPCPDSIGTNLRATMIVRLPRASKAQGFREACRHLKLQAQLADEEDTWKISNSERLGSSEAAQVSVVAEGVRLLVSAEEALSQKPEGEEVDLLQLIKSKQDPLPAVANEARQHQAHSDRLKVTVISARGLRDGDWFQGGSDPYCVCEISGKPTSAAKTRAVKGSSEPTWEQDVEVLDYAAGDSITLTIFDKDDNKADDFLGKATLASGAFHPKGFDGEVPLEKTGHDKEAFLKLRIGAAFEL